MTKDLDLFSGARGWEVNSLDLGIDALGIDDEWWAALTSKAAGMECIREDVAALKPSDFGTIRGLIASPPCVTFSSAGTMAGRQFLRQLGVDIEVMRRGFKPVSTLDPTTRLVLEPLRYALLLHPEWIAWEQVPSVLPVWQKCAEVLRERGYCVDTGVLSAERYGVPQSRRRALLIASRTRTVKLPRPVRSAFHQADPDRQDDGIAPWLSIGDAFGWDRDVAAATLLHSSANDRNRGSRFFVRPGTQPSMTVLFGNATKGWRWTRGEDTQWWLTPAEAATLQGFPDGYPFQGGIRAQQTLIGNAIPPPLARAVLEQVL